MGTVLTPWTYAVTLGTISTQILPANPGRKGVIFFNPSNVNVSVCPAFAPSGAAQPAVNAGAGSMIIVSFGVLILPQAGFPDSVSIASAFNGISTSPGTPFTIWEF